MPTETKRLHAVQMLVFCTALWALSFPTMKALAVTQLAMLPEAGSWFFTALGVMFSLCQPVKRFSGQHIVQLDCRVTHQEASSRSTSHCYLDRHCYRFSSRHWHCGESLHRRLHCQSAGGSTPYGVTSWGRCKLLVKPAGDRIAREVDHTAAIFFDLLDQRCVYFIEMLRQLLAAAPRA